MVVEARKEAEAMLAGQVAVTGTRRAAHRDASGLAAELLVFVDDDLEAPFRELVRGGESGHAAPEDGDASPRCRAQCGPARSEGQPGCGGRHAGRTQQSAP
jgi:hypothetical protein